MSPLQAQPAKKYHTQQILIVKHHPILDREKSRTKNKFSTINVPEKTVKRGPPPDVPPLPSSRPLSSAIPPVRQTIKLTRRRRWRLDLHLPGC